LLKTPVYLITGFLGSGKTTFIKRVLDGFAPDKKIAIVQNEFAPSNFDGKELKRYTNRNFELLEINNGSVFCVCLLSGFVQSFELFVIKHKPDFIFIETSGLSDPISVGEIFNSPQLQNIAYLAGSVCIVDATSFLKLEKLQQRIMHQVQTADTIIVNKKDCVEDLHEVQLLCKTVNPQANIIEASFCDVDIAEILGFKSSEGFSSTKKTVISAEDLGRPNIFSLVLKTVKPLKANNFEPFIQYVSAKLIRLKGYIILDDGVCKAVHIAMGQIQTESLEKPVRQTEIIALGYELNAGDFKKVYEKYC
jgi:G3E family GTPase